MSDAPIDVDSLAPLERACEWTSDTLGDSYVVTLTADHVDELAEAVAHARSAHDDLLDIGRDDFPLPTLGPVLADVTRDLIDGRGVVLLRGMPAGEWGKAMASTAYWGIGTHLGRPWPQNAKGHLLGDVTDQGRGIDDPTARGNEIGGVPFPFHSDGSDLVGLLCLDPGASGGASLVANALAIHNELVRTSPDLAAELYRPFPYDLRGEQAPGSRGWYEMPIFTRRGNRLFVRYIRPYIASSKRHADAPRPTEAMREAMDELDSLCAEPRYHASMTMQPGDIQFVNNYHVLHARRGYTDDRDAGRIRHLKRLWLETDLLTDDEKPDRYRLGRTDQHWSRHGRTQSDLVV